MKPTTTSSTSENEPYTVVELPQEEPRTTPGPLWDAGYANGYAEGFGDGFGDGIRASKNGRIMYEIGYEHGKRDAVKHGYWLEDDTGIMHYCSVCNKRNTVKTYMPDYCPHCGARMDGKDGAE